MLLLVQHAMDRQANRVMLSLTGISIRFLIEFSSLFLLVFLCIMHEFTDVTLAKQFTLGLFSKHVSFIFANLFDPWMQMLHLTRMPSPTRSNKRRWCLIKISKHHHRVTNCRPVNRVHWSQSIPSHSILGGSKSLWSICRRTKWWHCFRRPISLPVTRTVFVHNHHEELDIQMISISGNTEDFHCSFFEDKVIPGRSNTSFQVAFLARHEGLVNNTLYIHSSVGSFQYQVSAFGEISPFRVRPLIGARVPVNSSFASLIYIYNPFSTPLQVCWALLFFFWSYL